MSSGQKVPYFPFPSLTHFFRLGRCYLSGFTNEVKYFLLQMLVLLSYHQFKEILCAVHATALLNMHREHMFDPS